MEKKIIISTEGLTKVYGKQVAVDDLTFSVKEGEIFGFLGPNGAGKTTTLLMLLGLTEPTSGIAKVMDFEPMRDPIQVKKLIGYLPENMGFYRDLNAWQALDFICDLNGFSRSESDGRIENALISVGLFKERNKLVAAYSRGMRQRLGIAELLVKDPKVAFLDEPTLGLDPEATNQMIDLIKNLSEKHSMTFIISSHLLHQIQKISHRVGIMIKGKMVTQGRLEDLAREKLDVGDKEYTLEEIYMNYFQESNI